MFILICIEGSGHTCNKAYTSLTIHCTVMCENSEDPNEGKKLLVNGQATAAEPPDWSLLSDDSPVQISERTRALNCDVWQTFLDQDGRVINESALRRAVFKGIINYCSVYF